MKRGEFAIVDRIENKNFSGRGSEDKRSNEIKNIFNVQILLYDKRRLKNEETNFWYKKDFLRIVALVTRPSQSRPQPTSAIVVNCRDLKGPI